MNTNPRFSLIAAARHFYKLGWMMGTAGNLSARMPDSSFWITASGKQKGELSQADFVRVALDGTILERLNTNNRPSAETSIHQAIYFLFPDAQACYHVHSIEANLISNLTEKKELALPPLEMVKGLGVWEENPQVSIPIFDNYLNVADIASEIRDRFHSTPPSVPALLIRNHGVTVWGKTPAEALNYVEIAEYLFRYLVTSRQLGMDS